MEDFVADEQVQAKLSVAQGRPGFEQLSHNQCMTLSLMHANYLKFQVRDQWMINIH